MTAPSSRGRKLARELRELGDDEFAEFMDELEPANTDQPQQLSAAWRAEVKRRLEEVERGAVEAIEADDFHAELRRDFGAPE
jgi:hypothetical protein